MTTEVTLTGTGVPRPDPNRAGAGTLVRHGEVCLQFDAGRGTSMRLAQLGLAAADLTSLMITHHHSDHVVGVPDLVLSRWLDSSREAEPLTVVAPHGGPSRFVEAMLDPFVDDIAVRSGHGASARPEVDLRSFEAGPEPQVVWQNDIVTVRAVSVHHEPVMPAVAYRVDSPDGSVVISGDTIVCDELKNLASGVDVLVHEVFDREAVRPFFEHVPALERIAGYHAEITGLGVLAADAGVGQLVLTHLVPAPRSDQDEARFAAKIADAGYDGPVVVGRDLTIVSF